MLVLFLLMFLRSKAILLLLLPVMNQAADCLQNPLEPCVTPWILRERSGTPWNVLELYGT
jgi:hypothetical protein